MFNVLVRSILLSLLLALALNVHMALAAGKKSNLSHGLTHLKQPIPAPILKLKDMDEQLFDMTDLKGKVVVVNFWATWCPPCRDEMGSMERLYQATKDMGIVVVAVNVGEDADAVFPFMGTVEPEPTFPIVFDADAETAQNWGVKGLPTTYVVDPEGIVRFRALGGREFDHPELMMRVLSCRTGCK